MIATLPSGEHRSVKMEGFPSLESICREAWELWSCHRLAYTCLLWSKPPREDVCGTFRLWSASEFAAGAPVSHKVPCSGHKLRHRFLSLCVHKHTYIPLPCTVRQEVEFHLDRGIWKGLALPQLCVWISSLAVVGCCIKPSSFFTFSTSQFSLHPPKIFSMFFFLTRKINL